MGAYTSRQPAAPDDRDVAPKRYRSAAPDAFARTIEEEFVVSRVVQFAGFHAVLTLETLSWRSRKAVRGTRLEFNLDSSTSDSSVWSALKVAQREEILDARRRNLWGGASVAIFIMTKNRERRPSQVLFREDQTFLLSPRSRQQSVGVDAARSATSVAAAERRRATLLAVGAIEITVDVSETGVGREALGQEARAMSFQRSFFTKKLGLSPANDDATRNALVDAMGGPRVAPRRLVDAAARTEIHVYTSVNAVRQALDATIDLSVRHSATLDRAGLERLLIEFWKFNVRSEDDDNEWSITKTKFYAIASSANITNADAVWAAAAHGLLSPFSICYYDNTARKFRDDDDVQPGDEEHLVVQSYFFGAISAFAVTTIASGCPVKSFAPDCIMPWGNGARTWSGDDIIFDYDMVVPDRGLQSGLQALVVLADLAFRRPGERDDAAGQRRVEEAIASLLVPERIKQLDVGDAILFCTNASTRLVQRDELAWSKGTIVNAFGFGRAKIRLEDGQERMCNTACLRLVLDRPPAAAILLAVSLGDRRHTYVSQILASPLMSTPTLYEVPFETPHLCTHFVQRPTIIDHAIASGNTVGLGLLAARLGRSWTTALGACSTLCLAETHTLSPARRSDFHAALRSGPCAFFDSRSPWANLGVYGPEHPAVTVAGAGGGVRREIVKLRLACVRSQLVERPLHALSRIWTPRDNFYEWFDERPHELYQIAGSMLCHAAFAGHADVCAEIKRQLPSLREEVVADALCVAVAEGRRSCVEVLFEGAWRQRFVGHFASDSIGTLMIGLRILMEAIQVGDAHTIDLLRLAGCPFTFREEQAVTGRLLPLVSACYHGQPDATRAILRDPLVVADVLAHKSDAILAAASKGHADCLAVLLEVATIAHTNSDSTLFDMSPLQAATSAKSLSVVELILKQPNVDVEEAEPGIKTPLMIAVSNSDIALTTLLLAHGASVSSRGTLRPGDTPGSKFNAFDYSIHPKDLLSVDGVKIVKLLFRTRLDECALDDTLFVALNRRGFIRSGTLTALLDAGLDVSAQDEAYGFTALHWSIFRCVGYDFQIVYKSPFMKAVKVLLARGADLTLRTTTPFAADGDPDSIFNFDIPAGLTPIDIARTCGRPENRANATTLLEKAIQDVAAGTGSDAEGIVVYAGSGA